MQLLNFGLGSFDDISKALDYQIETELTIPHIEVHGLQATAGMWFTSKNHVYIFQIKVQGFFT